MVVPGAWTGRRPPRAPVLRLGGVAPLPAGVHRWLDGAAEAVHELATADAVMAESLRARPRLVLLDLRAAADQAEGFSACRRLKADAFTAIAPVVALVADEAGLLAALADGADEALRDDVSEAECAARLAALLRRSARDLAVHPTTRLPGTPGIAADLTRRLQSGEPFAACYADLDHFKEFNDRYGYTEGDRVIRMLSVIVHDVVTGHAGEAGFVGHIGGDDFFFVVPLAQAHECCATIVETFDLLVPYQYSEQDRRAGYYFGKDRRGQLHRVPLMSLSIGVVTTERRHLTDWQQVSRLASEMKGYAKTQQGSLYAVDRRVDEPPPAPARRSSPRAP